jgi:LPS-assembly protein
MRFSSVLTLFIAVLCGFATAHAATRIGDTESGYFFIADDVAYNDTTKMLTANGNVEITNGKNVVQADTLVYDQTKQTIVASGNVAVIEPTGDVLFADRADLTDDFANGFAHHASLLLSDNSRMSARAAQRSNSENLDLAQATYSPCDLCKTDPAAAPLWQVKADRVNHNAITRDVTYEDAWLEFADVPVLYIPQFSHPDPTVRRRTGFLTPTFGYGANIGTFLKTPYYYDISPDMDTTFTPTFSTEDGAQLAGEFRKRWYNSALKLDGSIVQTDLTEEDGTVKSNEVRGHVRGNYKYDINDYWRAGGDLFLASDKTYLDRYRYGAPDVLTNRAYLEGFNRRDYAAAEMYYFQDTRPGVRQSQPYVVPRLRAEAVGKPSGLDPDIKVPIGGRWKLNAEALSLERPKDKLDTRRVSAAAGWERTDIFPIGLVSTVNLDARADGYVTDNFTSPTSGLKQEQTSTMRALPSAQATLRYPLTRQFGTVQHTVEPIVAAFAAPAPSNNDIPNEDSQDFEFDYTNLFRASRFTGVDRQEGGSRVTYGVRTGVYGFGGGSASAFVGQSHRFRRDSDFALGSGLEKQTSDYVGNITIDPASWLFFDYNMRVDQASLQPRQHDINMSVGDTPLRFQANYLFLDEQTGILGGQSREEMAGALVYAFTDYWNAFVAQSRSFKPVALPLTTSLGINYVDECFNFGITATRDHTVRTGVQSGDTVYLRLLLKNLGGISTPSDAGNVFYREQR